MNGLKVIALGTRHPKNNWWNGFFRDSDIETLIVTKSGEAIKSDGLCVVERVIRKPFRSKEDNYWLITVKYTQFQKSEHVFKFNETGICEIGFEDYDEAWNVAKGSMFYK